MSRHTKTRKIVQNEMESMDDYDYESHDEQEQDFTEEQWEKIYNLSDFMQVSVQKAIESLKSSSGDFDLAVTIIESNNAKQAEKQNKKQEKQIKKEKEKDKDKEKVKEKEKDKEKEKNIIPPSPKLIPKKSSEIQQHRKISEEGIIPQRKLSHMVEEIDTNHYNQQYPAIQVHQNIKVSKTINIVVVGHVDAGKSTLVGMLLQEIKYISQKEAHKNQKLSKQIGKQSFQYAWVTDETEQERNRGITIDIGVKKVKIQDKEIVFLDSPGHKDFVPNMITGAAQADYAILLIDVIHFQSTFVSGGQTKQHAYIVKSLGVSKIIVAVNKMDLINWNVEKFQIVKKKMNFYLLKIGFKEESIIYVPVSAFYGVNITKKMQKPFETFDTKYNETLLDHINNLPVPVRPMNKPFRMSITNFYQSPQGKLKGHCLSGKIEGGVIKKDDKLVILPQNCQCIVKEILLNDEKVKQAVVGDNIEVLIKLIDQTYFETIKYGNVLSSIKYCIPVSKNFIVEALALDLEIPILKGTPIVLYIGTNKSPARIIKINYIFDPSNGTIIKKNPKSIRTNDCAEIEIETDNKICVETFTNFKIYGRVIIRQKNETLCVGTVKMIK